MTLKEVLPDIPDKCPSCNNKIKNVAKTLLYGRPNRIRHIECSALLGYTSWVDDPNYVDDIEKRLKKFNKKISNGIKKEEYEKEIRGHTKKYKLWEKSLEEEGIFVKMEEFKADKFRVKGKIKDLK